MRWILFLIIFVVSVGVAYYITKPVEEKPLKIYAPNDIEADLVAEDLQNIGINHRVASFSFLDQNGKEFGSKNMKNNIYVAEYFFTTCGTICPVMNQEMQRVQKEMQVFKDFHILSFTVNPETDSVAQLKKYAKEHAANDKQWHFLTGKKDDLYQLARRSFFVLKPAETVNQGDVGSDFIHTQYFVLVDKKQQIRGYYEGTKEKDVDKLIHDAKLLLNEKS